MRASHCGGGDCFAGYPPPLQLLPQLRPLKPAACSLCAIAIASAQSQSQSRSPVRRELLVVACRSHALMILRPRRGALGINRDAAARPIRHWDCCCYWDSDSDSDWDWEVWNALGPSSVYFLSRERVASRCFARRCLLLLFSFYFSFSRLLCRRATPISRFLSYIVYLRVLVYYFILFLVFLEWRLHAAASRV